MDVSPKLKDAFNKLLIIYLQTAVPKVSIESVTIPREGLCMKFNPLHTSRILETSKADIDDFVEKLQEKTLELSHTLINRSSFRDVFQHIPDLVLIEVIDEPILGAFQCIPKYWKTKNMSNLSDMKKHEANELNTKIYLGLSNVYSFIDKATLANGQIYVQVGVVDPKFNLPKFAEVVTRCTIEMEDNAKFVESLTDTVQKCIEEANQRLEKEREEKFFQDDVLRNVPLVSNFYNWWSPPPKENHGVVGKSLDLSSGKLESTDKTYKFKMQIHGDQSDTNSHVSSLSLQNEPPIGESTIDAIIDEDNGDESIETDATLSEDDSADENDGENITEATENTKVSEAIPVDSNHESDGDKKEHTTQDNVTSEETPDETEDSTVKESNV